MDRPGEVGMKAQLINADDGRVLADSPVETEDEAGFQAAREDLFDWMLNGHYSCRMFVRCDGIDSDVYNGATAEWEG